MKLQLYKYSNRYRSCQSQLVRQYITDKNSKNCPNKFAQQFFLSLLPHFCLPLSLSAPIVSQTIFFLLLIPFRFIVHCLTANQKSFVFLSFFLNITLFFYFFLMIGLHDTNREQQQQRQQQHNNSNKVWRTRAIKLMVHN